MKNTNEIKPVVLVVASHFRKGGAERQLSLVAEELARKGLTVIHLCLADQPVDLEAESIPNLKRIAIGTHSFRSPLLLLKFWKICSKYRPSTIISCVTVCDFLACFWATFHREVRWLMREPSTFQSTNRKQRWSLRNWLGKFANVVIANNKGGFEYWQQARGSRPTVLIPNILELDTIKARSLARIEGSESLIKENFFICVGRLESPKNFALAIAAFHEFRKTFTGFQLVFVGDGSLKDNLISQAKHNGDLDAILFLGYLANPYPLINSAKALVLTSLFEGLPNVAMEALALETPLILSDIPSHTDVFSTEVATFFNAKNSDSLAVCMKNLAIDSGIKDDDSYAHERNARIEQWEKSKIGQSYRSWIVPDDIPRKVVPGNRL